MVFCSCRMLCFHVAVERVERMALTSSSSLLPLVRGLDTTLGVKSMVVILGSALEAEGGAEAAGTTRAEVSVNLT